MPASISKLGVIFLGAIAGLLAVAILVLVPVLGVRKELNLIVIDWQELVFYSSCFLAGTIGGARVAFREFQRVSTSSAEYDAFLRSDDEASVADDIKERAAPSDDELPLLTEPVFEESLAVGPRKAKKGFWTAKSKSRTSALLMFIYLVLFVMCAVLCQKMSLGNIVSDPISAEVIRTIGVGTAVLGLYLIIRGLFVRVELKFGVMPASSESQTGFQGKTVDTAKPIDDFTADALVQAGEFPVKIEESEFYHAPHVPPSKLGFLRRHPVCAGWLVVLTGLPLVFQAWFPLLAIPGLFIGMNWLFPDKAKSY